MSDDADKAQEASQPLLEADVAAVRNRASKMVPGQPGTCGLCGEFFSRVIFNEEREEWVCGRCRDKHNLP